MASSDWLLCYCVNSLPYVTGIPAIVPWCFRVACPALKSLCTRSAENIHNDELGGKDKSGKVYSDANTCSVMHDAGESVVHNNKGKGLSLIHI